MHRIAAVDMDNEEMVLSRTRMNDNILVNKAKAARLGSPCSINYTSTTKNIQLILHVDNQAVVAPDKPWLMQMGHKYISFILFS